MSFQDFKLRKKQIYATFSYFLINNALLYHFLANWLAHNKKNNDWEICFSWSLKSWNGVTIIPSPAFGLAVLYPIRSEIWRFWYIKTQVRKIAIENFSFSFSLLYISVQWGDLIEQIKKTCHIHFKLSYTNISSSCVPAKDGRFKCPS